ncbi:MAG: alpha-L-fucosidase 2, partial [Humisphaera sp.]|nr:alpha-L-fucosidase 2 [Humisphaera sp.]
MNQMSQPTRRTILKTAATVAAAGLLSKVPGAAAQERPNEHDGDPLLLIDDRSPRHLALWYDQPSTKWVEALPIGNGRLGGMIHGGVGEERIELNDNTLYSGEPGRRDLPTLNVSKTLEQVNQQLRDGKYAEVTDWVSKNWLGRQQECYQPLGDLYLKFASDAKPTAGQYRRELDLAGAIAKTTYTHDGVTFVRECFASFPDQSIVMLLSANKPGAISFSARLASIHPNARQTTDGNDTIVMAGQVPAFVSRRDAKWIESRGDQWKYPELYDKDGKRKPDAKDVMYGDQLDGLGTRFETRVRLQADGGSVTTNGETIDVKNANRVVL